MEWVRKLVDGKGGGEVQARYRGWVVVGGIRKSARHALSSRGPSNEELAISTQSLGLQSAKSVKPMDRLGVGV